MEFRQMARQETEYWYQNELCTAFLPQECKPFADICALQEGGRYELWGLFENGDMLGYAALWKAPDIPLVLLDYLGVTALQRNHGLGTEILKCLKEQGRPLVLESELPIVGEREEDNQLRLRRMDFYCRNGFVPVYRMATCGLAWQALLYDPTNADIADIMRWHRELYGPERHDVKVPLPDGEVPKMPYWMQNK